MIPRSCNRQTAVPPFASFPFRLGVFQCCEDSCISGFHDCGDNGYHCLDPAFYDPELVAQYPDCTGRWSTIGDSWCDESNNNAACGYDGGDCCLCSCRAAACIWTFFDCKDSTADDELYECKEMPAPALPCSAEVQQAWTVENSEQAQALAAAVNCSGGSFEVEWRGRIVVNQPIYVMHGTVLSVKGAGHGAVIDGNASTRIFTVVDAALHLSDINVTSGASVAGGAIAAAASVMTFDQTNFIGNSATGFGGAVFVSNGSNVTCTGEGTFANNRADVKGGAMYVTGGSTVSCGGSWFNNTVGNSGGAVAVLDSSVSWKDEAVFAFNSASYGGALSGTGSSVFWSGATAFIFNSAEQKGGAVFFTESTVSWSSDTTFANCTSTYRGTGGAMDVEESTIYWSGNTEFLGNYAGIGGAIYTFNGTSISWTGTTEFTSNTAHGWGGVVGSWPLDPFSNRVTSALVMNGFTTFSNNSCDISGGALALLGGLTLEIGAVDVSFVNNTAAVSGGAVFVSGTGVGQTFPGVSFVSNSAQVGGAVSSVSSGNLPESGSIMPTTFDRCHFVDNRATATGGAVESAAGQDSFVGSVFEGNKAVTGGALRLAGMVYMENCSFVENTSDDGGGAAVSNIGSILKMEHNSFSGNVFDCEPGMFLSYIAVSVGIYTHVVGPSREKYFLA